MLCGLPLCAVVSYSFASVHVDSSFDPCCGGQIFRKTRTSNHTKTEYIYPMAPQFLTKNYYIYKDSVQTKAVAFIYAVS